MNTLFPEENFIAGKLPNEWFAPIASLTEIEKQILGFVGFSREVETYDTMTGLCRINDWTITRTKKIKEKLLHEGYLITYSYHIVVAPKCLFPAILYTIDRHPDWIKRWNELPYKQQLSKSNLYWVLCQRYYAGEHNLQDISKSLSLARSWTEYTFQALQDWIGTDFFAAALSSMPINTLTEFALSCFNFKQQFNQPLTPEFCAQWHEQIDTYHKLNPRYPVLHIHDMVDCFYFMATGHFVRFKQNETSATEWSVLPDAILALYAGDYARSLKLFTEAQKLHNQISDIKNVFPNTLLSFYMLLCFAKNKEVKRAQQFLRKKDIEGVIAFRPAQLIARFIINGENPMALRQEMTYIRQKGTMQLQWLTALVAHHFGIDFSLPETTCQWALLRYELSGMGMPCEDHDTLLHALGGAPIFTTLRRKSQWEIVLEQLTDLTKSKAKEDATPAPERVQRLVYVLHSTDDDDVKLMQQKWLRSDRWGTPSHASVRSFLNHSIAYADEKDQAIARACAYMNSYYYDDEIPLASCLPSLIDTDKLLLYNSRTETYQTIQVIDEKPFLLIEKKGNAFTIKSNLPDERNISTMMYVWHKQESISVYRLSKQELSVFAKLLDIRTFPLEAEAPLKAFLDSAKGTIEVHSSLVEGGSTLEKRQAQTIPTIRIEPEDDLFKVSVYISPFEGSRLRLTPGKGDAVVFDEEKGKRYQVERNLEEETKMLEPLVLFCTQGKYRNGLFSEDIRLGLSLEGVLSLLAFLQECPVRYFVEWPQGEKFKVHTSKQNPDNSVQLRQKQNWFEVEGTLQMEDEHIVAMSELLRLMRSGSVGKRFVRLDNGEFLALSESLAKQLHKLEQIAQIDKTKARITRYQAGSLADIIRSSDGVIHANRQVSSLAKQISEAATMRVDLPRGLKAQLRDYQQIGYEWISRLAAWGAGGCLADDMGLGKTVQAIAFLLQRAEEGASLVVAPASVVLNWQNEIMRFAPALRVRIFNDAEDRQSVIDSQDKYDVLLCTYGLLARETEMLSKKEWNVVCLDEAHTIKNRSTKMSAAAMALQSKARLLLTGTPIQNHLSELWNLMEFLNPGLLGSFEAFRTQFILPIEQEQNTEKHTALRRIIQPFILRRTKADVLSELPDKEDIIRRISLTDSERMEYEALRIQAQKELETEDKVTVSLLSNITRLREAACSLSLVDKSITAVSSKLEDMRQLVQQIVEGGNSVLVFSQFTSFLSQAKQVLDEDKTDYFYLDGSTPIAQRQKMVEAFQRGEKAVFLISLKAGGLGLNLTNANYIIHLDPWWNPAIEQQATDRAYRIGQHRSVTVYHLIAADTIEEKILRLHQTKRDLSDSLLEGTDTSHTLTIDDLKYLVSLQQN